MISTKCHCEGFEQLLPLDLLSLFLNSVYDYIQYSFTLLWLVARTSRANLIVNVYERPSYQAVSMSRLKIT